MWVINSLPFILPFIFSGSVYLFYFERINSTFMKKRCEMGFIANLVCYTLGYGIYSHVGFYQRSCLFTVCPIALFLTRRYGKWRTLNSRASILLELTTEQILSCQLLPLLLVNLTLRIVYNVGSLILKFIIYDKLVVDEKEDSGWFSTAEQARR